MSSPTPFKVITTLRFDPSNPFPSPGHPEEAHTNLLNLPKHVQRLQVSAAAAGWHSDHSKTQDPQVKFGPAVIYRHLQSNFGDVFLPSGPPYRVRLELDEQGKYSVTAGKTGPVTIYSHFNPFFPERLPEPSELADAGNGEAVKPTWKVCLHGEATERSFHTTYKTSERAVYDQARKGHDIGTEIVLQNDRGEVMDGTISSVYFWRKGRWVTPQAECGPLVSVSRDFALQTNLAVEGVVKMSEVQVGEVVWLGNGLRGFGWGRIEG